MGWFRVAAGWLLLIAVTACGGSDASPAPRASQQQAASVELALPTEVPTAEPTAAPTVEPLDFEVGPSDLPGFTAVMPGRYTMGELGVPVSFELETLWLTQPVGPGYFVLSHQLSTGPGDHDVVFLRPRVMLDATTGVFDDALVDPEAWLDTVGDGIEIGPLRQTMVGDLPAVSFTLEVGDDAACRIVGVSRCADLMIAGFDFLKTFDRSFLYEVWWITTEETPLLIVVGTTSSDPGWLDVGRSVVESVELG